MEKVVIETGGLQTWRLGGWGSVIALRLGAELPRIAVCIGSQC